MTVLEKTAGVMTDARSSSTVSVVARITSTDVEKTLSLEFMGMRITIPYVIIEDMNKRIGV